MLAASRPEDFVVACAPRFRTTFTNAQRLELVLALIRLYTLGLANYRIFQKVLRERFEAHEGRADVGTHRCDEDEAIARR